MTVYLLLFPLVACAKKSSMSESQFESQVREASRLTERTTEDGLVEQRIDVNTDGQPDIFNFYKARADGPRQLVRKETDLNMDGRVDVRTKFDETGRIEQEELDGDFDGQVDWVDHYKGGKRVMSEVDTDYNGAFDLFKYYESGKTRRKERDSNGDGKVDYWEYLDDQGAVVKTGRDVDGDGVMDVRDN